MTPEGLFKPKVIFFGLTNSTEMFQMIMNKILQNLINIREVVSVINDIIVGTKEEKGHDKTVEEVIRRLVENDLYVKLEKCKWKVREVEFLGVVIKLEGIKIEEEKVKTVLSWPTFNKVKDV